MDFQQLGLFDYAVFAVLIISTLIAFFRGFIASSFSFITWFGGVAIAMMASPFLEPLLEEKISSTIGRYAASAIGTYIVVIIVLSLLSIPARRFVYRFINTAFDQALGFVFGIARGMVIVCVAFIVIVYTYGFINGSTITRQEMATGKKTDVPVWLANAQTYGFLKLSSQFIIDFIPEVLFDAAEERVESTKETVGNTILDKLGSTGLQLKHKEGTLPVDLSAEQLNQLQNILSEQELMELLNNSNTDIPTIDKGYTDRQLKEIEKIINNSQ